MTQTPIIPGRYSYEDSGIDVVALGSRVATGNTNGVRVNSRAFLLQTQVANIGTSVTVRLEGSLDGINYFTLGTDTTYSANGFFALTLLEIPVAFVRANLVTINTGTPTVTFTLGAF
jgi:hypothetical protein